jgi:hypothetical protein
VGLELQENLHQEALRDAMLSRDAFEMHRLPGVVATRQVHHGNARILGFGGEFHDNLVSS